MEMLKIDPEFKNKIPPLTEAEFQQLKENILADGEVYEPIVVWNGTIIDGHNRWRVINEHPSIPYRVKNMDFADKWAAFDWMYKKQLGRRNLTDEQKTYLLGKLYEARKKVVGGDGTNQYNKEECAQSGHKARTAEVIAVEVGVGRETVKRAEKFSKGVDALKEVSEEAAEKIMSGNSGVAKSDVSEIVNMNADEKKQFAEDVVSGDVKKRRGWTKADRESRALTERIVAEMKDTEHLPVFTIDALVECMEIDAENYISSLRNRLVERSELLTPENKKILATMIETKIINEIQKIKELVKA